MCIRGQMRVLMPSPRVRARAGSAAVGPQGGDEGIGGAALALVDAAAREHLSDVLGV